MYLPNTDTVIAHPRGHEGLPPAFFQIDGMDPLRDEGMIPMKLIVPHLTVVARSDLRNHARKRLRRQSQSRSVPGTTTRALGLLPFPESQCSIPQRTD